MELETYSTKNTLLTNYIDCYQLYQFTDSVRFTAIPNGRVELWVILSGSFYLYDYNSGQYQPAQDLAIHPPTNQLTHFYVPDDLICLNIKGKPAILELFSCYLTSIPSPNTSFRSFLPENTVRKIEQFRRDFDGEVDVSLLDDWLVGLLISCESGSRYQQILNQFESNFDVNIGELSDRLHMSEKTLQRTIRKYLNLCPKELLSLVRFRQVSEYLKTDPSARLIEALDFGYYDQSHFIKECRKITGLNPTAFISKLKLPVNDLMIEWCRNGAFS